MVRAAAQNGRTGPPKGHGWKSRTWSHGLGSWACRGMMRWTRAGGNTVMNTTPHKWWTNSADERGNARMTETCGPSSRRWRGPRATSEGGGDGLSLGYTGRVGPDEPRKELIEAEPRTLRGSISWKRPESGVCPNGWDGGRVLGWGRHALFGVGGVLPLLGGKGDSCSLPTS